MLASAGGNWAGEGVPPTVHSKEVIKLIRWPGSPSLPLQAFLGPLRADLELHLRGGGVHSDTQLCFLLGRSEQVQDEKSEIALSLCPWTLA